VEETRKKNGVKTFFSGIYLLLSLCLLLVVCAHCYPQAEVAVRQAIAGATDGPVQEAFGVLAEGLGEYRPVKEVLRESYEVLTGAAS